MPPSVSLPREEFLTVAEVKPVPIANPAPLGLSGFALTTFVLSVVNTGILVEKNTAIVIGLAVFYGGIAQFAAGMWEFRTGNTFGATAFTSYGAFWLSFGAILIPGFGVVLDTASANSAVGVYLLGWAIITGLLMLGSFRINGALATVFVLLFITFLLLAIGKLTSSGPTASGWTVLGGWVGILTAIAAWYTALAGILSHVSGGKMVLPVYPLA
jgi:succinate-acetate transporter protein